MPFIKKLPVITIAVADAVVLSILVFKTYKGKGKEIQEKSRQKTYIC